ncbi:ADP-ribose diphosphatase [Marinobacterium halophilum]|uniref:ADP-ribose diphosphatase n=1 Tax=Marinobacterium halophilum TaxID=267374 RepID=A0A2P8EY51_9GAMM|nr:ADP compounds hydrolase NudE [Marinobacterium halophilum]PSL14396.1 ADP-ribose diphosphatase [Marinobacterium halophilum]
MPAKPEILKLSPIANSRLFHIEAMELRFSNGVERRYERLMTGGNGAVMVVAINEYNQVVLIREYAAGLDDYVLTLPKGLIDPGEDALTAANRELQEEAGFAADQLTFIKQLTAAPNYMGHRIDVILARSLSVSKLEGDEPEPLEVVLWPLDNLPELFARDEFSEGRSIAALCLVEQLLRTT